MRQVVMLDLSILHVHLRDPDRPHETLSTGGMVQQPEAVMTVCAMPKMKPDYTKRKSRRGSLDVQRRNLWYT